MQGPAVSEGKIGTRELQAAIESASSPEAAGKLQGLLDRLYDRADKSGEEPSAQLAELAAPFKTALQLRGLSSRPRRAGETFSFAVVGDAEPGRFWIFRKLFNKPGVFRKLMGLVAAQDVDFSIQLGDMVSRGTESNYRRFFTTLRELALPKPYLTVIGNHDRRRPHGISDNRFYRALFGPSDYYFDRGGFRFVVVDNSAQRLGPEQLAWLDRTLDTTLQTLVFAHIPPAELSAWTDYRWLKGIGGFKEGSREFTEIVSRRGVSRVYVGHIHAFSTLAYRGVRYVLTGGGGSPLFPSAVTARFHHFLTVEAGPGGLRETVHKADGTSYPVAAAPFAGWSEAPLRWAEALAGLVGQWLQYLD